MEQIIKNVNYRPNSYCFRANGTGSDVKIYFEDAEDLEKQITEFNKASENIKKQINEIKERMKD